MDPATTVTLALGQAVYWPPSPTGYAQVAELRRTNVVLLYPAGRRGHVCRPVVPAARVAERMAAAPLLFPLANPFGRGFWPASKAFVIPPLCRGERMSTATLTTTTLTPWFGSNRSLAREAGAELAGLGWVGVAFAGGMSEVPHIGARTLVLNDLHSHLINLGRVIASPDLFPAFQSATEGKLFHPAELADAQRRCLDREATAAGGLFGLPAAAAAGAPDLAWAVDYWVACWMGRSSSAGTDGEFRGNLSVRWNAGGGDSAVRYRSATASAAAWHALLRRANFTQLDCFEFLAAVKDAAGHGLYCDPPFPSAGHEYKHKFTEAMHRRLAARLAGFTATRVVCRFYSDHPLVRELYPPDRWTWRHLAGGRKQTNAAAPEVLLINGPSLAAAA